MMELVRIFSFWRYTFYYWLILINLPSDIGSAEVTCEPLLDGVESPLVYVPGFGSLYGSTTVSYWKKRKIFQYLGIPFAEPPIGNLRFRQPEKIRRTQYSRYDATSFKRKCPQLVNEDDDHYLSHTTDPIEDCLYLNVFTPERNSNERLDLLPVMVYIHGGGFYQGSAVGLCPNYLLDSDVILVTINYRLGPLGFLCLHTENAPGNVGFLDQIMALEWVNENVVHFGGDKNRVTLFGQSAGGVSTSLHLVSPAVRPGLFQQVIIQSGHLLWRDWYLDADPIANVQTYANYLNCTRQNVYDLLNCLMTVPAQDLIRSNIRYMNDIVIKEKCMARNIGIGQAVIQKAGYKKFLTEDPIDTFKKGSFLKLPTLIGFTKHEGSMIFAAFYEYMLKAKGSENCFEENNCVSSEYSKDDIFYDYLRFLSSGDKANVLELIKDKYFPRSVRGDLTAIVPGFTDLASNIMVKIPTLEFARHASSKMPTYLYTFNFKGRYSKIGYGRVVHYPFPTGVAHSDDLIYLFRYKNETLNEDEIAMAKIMSSLWANFAINNGKPIINDSVNWPPVSTKYGPYVIIDKQIKIEDDLLAEYQTELNGNQGAVYEARANACKITSLDRWIMLLISLLLLIGVEK